MFDELIGRWWIVAARGIGELRLRRMIDGDLVNGEWLLGASGVLSLLFGGLVAVQSDAAARHLCGSSADTRSSLVRCCWPWR
jgi:hypothetical protein